MSPHTEAQPGQHTQYRQPYQRTSHPSQYDDVNNTEDYTNPYTEKDFSPGVRKVIDNIESSLKYKNVHQWNVRF